MKRTSMTLPELKKYIQTKEIKRLYLVGSVGSGKTTLGKKLAEEFHIPFYEMDNLIFERLETGDRRREDDEIGLLLETIFEEKVWLIEGTCLRDIIQPVFDKSQVLIFLEVPYYKRIYRFTKRFLKQVLHLEKANYLPSFDIYLKMFKWNHQFEKEGRTIFKERSENNKNKRIYLKN